MLGYCACACGRMLATGGAVPLAPCRDRVLVRAKVRVVGSLRLCATGIVGWTALRIDL